MRIVLAPAGSRGDFQPLLALGVALREAGHEVLLVSSPDFLAEARAFGLRAEGAGFDVQRHFREGGFEARPLAGAAALFALGRRTVGELIASGLEHCRGADLVVGAGAQIAAPTIAEALGVPYAFVAYTPQALRSAHHPPFTVPLLGLPRVLNRLLWVGFLGGARLVLGGPLNRARAALGLGPVRDWYQHLFPDPTTLLAADPELAPPAADARLAFPPVGALHLDDRRALPPGLEAFLREGPPPVYLGFGSMPDLRADRTTATLLQVAREVGCRLVLSGGWAGYGGVAEGAAPLAEGVLAVGPVSHALLFPRVAAVVHHGGAGTTGAAARAGRPQLVVPHLFDQFLWARWVERAGVGRALPRRRLGVETLRGALRQLLADAGLAGRAQALGAAVRGRDAGRAAVEALEAIAAGPGRRPASAGRGPGAG